MSSTSASSLHVCGIFKVCRRVQRSPAVEVLDLGLFPARLRNLQSLQNSTKESNVEVSTSASSLHVRENFKVFQNSTKEVGAPLVRVSMLDLVSTTDE